tara:strand:+ start:312 stop:950 length:639 start_codon:yes stop_codon:yes gene_type:complete
MTFDIDWWWEFQDQINAQFNFSRTREEVATRMVVHSDFLKTSISHYFRGRDLVLIGAAINHSLSIPNSSLIVADGALRACLEKDIIPELIISDLDGYLPDMLWATQNGSKIIIHAHGDNISRVHQYSAKLNPICITSTYPSDSTFCWGGFTDGDRATMMSLSLGCASIKLLGFDFNKVGSFSGEYSPRKIEKLVWAQRIIDECKRRSTRVSY